jgi:hypothetical protein
MKRNRSLLASFMTLAIAPSAWAAPPDKAPAPAPAPEKGAPAAAPGSVHVVHLASGVQDRDQALRLTKALEQRVLQLRTLRFVNSNKSLLNLLDQAKCGQLLTNRALDKTASLNERSGDDIDDLCRSKIAVGLGEDFGPAERFFWGWVYRDAAARPMVTLNYWTRGQINRKFSLPLTEPIDRLADRLVQHLLYPGQVGDVRVVSAKVPRGDIFVGTEAQGKLDGEPIELTLPVGVHVFELRKGETVLARGRGVVLARESRQIDLEPVTSAPAPPPVLPPPRVYDLPPPSRKPPPVAWVASGIGVAGLAGAGALLFLRQRAESDLEDSSNCATSYCRTSEKDTIDRSNLYGTLAPISLGVGVLGIGAATYFFLRPSPAHAPSTATSVSITGAAAPTAGGGAAFLVGSF